MTKREAAIVAAYTGFLIGDFHDMHQYVEEIMGRPVWTHEMGDTRIALEIREKAKHDFVTIRVEDPSPDTWPGPADLRAGSLRPRESGGEEHGPG